MNAIDSREEARGRILRRQIFVATLTAFLVISPTVLAVYWLTGPHPIFWALYPILGLLVAAGYTGAGALTGLPGEISDHDIEREKRRTDRDHATQLHGRI